MKVLFMLLGFAFLGVSLFLVPKAEDDMHIFDAQWQCQPPDETTGVVQCATRGAPDITVKTMSYMLWTGMMGVGCLVVAAAFGMRGRTSPPPASQPGPAVPGPMPHPHPQPHPHPHPQPPAPSGLPYPGQGTQLGR